MPTYRMPVTITETDRGFNPLCVNVHHFEADDDAAAASASEALWAMLEDARVLYTVNMTLANFGTVFEVPAGGTGPARAVAVPEHSIAGEGAGALGSIEGLAFCTTYRTGVRGRSYQGRTYWGPLAMTVTQSSIPEASVLLSRSAAGLLGWLDALLAESDAAADWTWVVYSPTLDVSTPITSVSYFPQWAFLRSRRD